ncbi:DUF4365 domain-containing protein [Nocardioides sp. NBC_00368]|uniref:DUF4365 domain-containing protein n=1 Tax=Nocardioides sp. NBC_00368 TaxID=2976000 RepID=UPI002E1E956D
MEQLQEGYVASVAATAGAIAEFRKRDMHKYDVELSRQPDVGFEEVAVRLQLKSTTTIRPQPHETHIKFRFKTREDFNSLAMPRDTIKHILVVMVVGADQRAWTEASHDVLSLRHCCYWINLEGQVAPDVPKQPVVEVPRSNVFDASSVTAILDRIEQGQKP